MKWLIYPPRWVRSWEDAFREYLVRLDQQKPVILCGDLNVAHEEINLKNPKTNRQQVAIVKLSKRNEAHRADFADDYQVLKELYEGYKREETLKKWIEEKQKSTYVFIEEGWRNCEFKYKWLNIK